MLTLQDCIAFSGLTPEQIDAVAAYKHIPPVVAAEWAEYVLDQPNGEREVECVLWEEADLARTHGDKTEAVRYQHGLDDFIRCHPHP